METSPQRCLREARKKSGLTAREWAERLRRSVSYVYALETGERSPGLETAHDIERLTAALGMTIPKNDWLP
jgi:transcriptional regulator with XRE-family HTH domain